MKNEMYIVRGMYGYECATEPLYTDREHLETCAKEAAFLVKQNVEDKGMPFDKSKVEVHCNEAVFCFGGYLTNGDYCGSLKVE